MMWTILLRSAMSDIGNTWPTPDPTREWPTPLPTWPPTPVPKATWPTNQPTFPPTRSPYPAETSDRSDTSDTTESSDTADSSADITSGGEISSNKSEETTPESDHHFYQEAWFKWTCIGVGSGLIVIVAIIVVVVLVRRKKGLNEKSSMLTEPILESGDGLI